jgi:hypothetical protein
MKKEGNMVKFETSQDGKVSVFFGEKVLDFSLDRIPGDWQVLFRDPDTAGCVNQVVLSKGIPLAERGRREVPVLGWDEVRICIEEVDGSTG